MLQSLVLGLSLVAAATGSAETTDEAIELAVLALPESLRDGAAVNYNLRGPGLDNAVATTVVYVPFATGESLGITEERNFYRPWLMFPGTAFAHIMIPGQ